MNNYERELLAIIEEHGWQASLVFDPKGIQPSFGYSVGFPKTIDCPDCIVVGLRNEVMQAMLWEVFRQIRDGKTLQHGVTWNGLLGGDYQCVSIRCNGDLTDTKFRHEVGRVVSARGP